MEPNSTKTGFLVNFKEKMLSFLMHIEGWRAALEGYVLLDVGSKPNSAGEKATDEFSVIAGASVS